MTRRQVCFISVLLLMACLAVSCGNVDSKTGEAPNQSATMQAQAGVEHLQQVTLRITGMS